MTKTKSLASLLLAFAILCSLFAVPVSASSYANWNVSKSAVTGNYDDASLPASLSELSPGDRVYFNFHIGNSEKLKQISLYIQAPGQSSFYCYDTSSARNYMRYTYFSYTVGNTSGTLSYYFRVKFTNGYEVDTSTSSVTVRGSSNDSYYPRYTGSSSSLVDALKSLGINSSKSFRATIWDANFSGSYSASADQNLKLLNLLKSGTLKRPGNVPPQLDNDDNIVSASNISSAAYTYGISTNNSAYRALESINSKYAGKLSSQQKNGTLVFLFEGVGNDSSASTRMNAMCVVVKNHNIVYINRNSSTIPDYPFNPKKNEGTPMPTVKSGIYDFYTTNHRGSYAALHISDPAVLRFKSKTYFYSDTSSAINVHRRSSNSIASSSASWVNSAGCQIIGKTGTSSSSEYARFIQAVGIVGDNAKGDSTFSYRVSGKIIIDRSYAASYLQNIGYTQDAISMLG